MADALSIAPVALSTVAGLAPVAATQPATARVAADSSLFAAHTETVDLSTEGQLLSALATFQAAVANETAVAVPGATAETATAESSEPTTAAAPPAAAEPTAAAPAADAATPPPSDPAEAILAAAQSLVDAFNTLLDSALALPTPVTAAPSADEVAAQLVATLTSLATTPLGADDATLALPAIGINPTPTASGALALQLDPQQLAAAVASNPAATQATLSGATQALAAVAAGAEAQLASAAVPPLPPADLNLLGTATPVPSTAAELLELTPTPGAPLPVADDTAADGAIILPADEAIRAALQAIGLEAASTTAPPVAVTPGAAEVTAALTAPSQPPVTTTVAAPTAAIATAVTAAAPVAATITPPAADALAAEQRSTAASLALQSLLADPRLRALDNQADPAYAAMIAATHLSDFDSPRPFTDPRALNSDSVGPVSALLRDQAIADYREAAGEAEQRALIGTNTTRQYWV